MKQTETIEPVSDVELPALTREEFVDLEYGGLDLNVGEHVMVLYRDQLIVQRVMSRRELVPADGTWVRVAGLRGIRQGPMAYRPFD